MDGGPKIAPSLNSTTNILQWWKLAQLYITYNHFHNILRLFDVLPNFPFPTSETMRDYYL